MRVLLAHTPVDTKLLAELERDRRSLLIELAQAQDEGDEARRHALVVELEDTLDPQIDAELRRLGLSYQDAKPLLSSDDFVFA